jgi:iron complex transport system substrate-binding protein
VDSATIADCYAVENPSMARWTLVCLLVFSAWSCSSDKNPAERARKSGTSGIPQRVISLAPSATELVVALGMSDRLVGRDQYSVTPAEIAKLPALGDFLSPNVEAAARLEPDLVLLDKSQARANEALEALGVPTLPLPMHQLADVRSGLIEVGRALGDQAGALALVAQIDAQIQTYAAKGELRKEPPVVLAIIDRDPDSLRNLIAAGPKTYLDELLTLVGARNMMAGSAVRYPQIAAEQILRSAPDIIIDLSKSEGGLAAYQSISEAPAVVHRRVHILQEPLLLSPTPRVGEALERIYALTEQTSAL